MDGVPMVQPVGFRRHLRAEVSASGGTYVFYERGVTAVSGPQIARLAPLLDGTRELSAVIRDLQDDMPPEQVTAAVNRLAEAGLVSVRNPEEHAVDECALAYWDAAGVEPVAAASAVAAATVDLVIAGDVDPEPVLAELREAGLTVCSASDGGVGDGELAVVLCDDYLNPALARVDADLRAAGRPWLLARPGGTAVWIGPIMRPEVTGCWHCLSIRLWSNRGAEASAQWDLGRAGPAPRPAASVRPVTSLASAMIALEAAKWLAGHRYPGQSGVWTLDSIALRWQFHQAPRLPQCRACGDPGLVARRTREPVRLGSRRGVSAGGRRAMHPAQVWATYSHLISPVTGVVKHVEPDHRGPEFFNRYRSGANVAVPGRGLAAMRVSLRAENSGKGATDELARTSALCEALERYSGDLHGDEERIPASLAALGDDAVHPNSCQLFHDRQYRDRDLWNAAHGSLQHVAEPFDEHAVVDWTPVWSLTQSRQRLLPTAMLYFGVPRSAAERGLARADSNGNAAGASMEDAVLHGLLELVERDAVALWWYNRTPMPEVDLDAVGDPWIDELRRVYADLGRTVWVLDVTSDIGVPVMVAVSRRVDGPREDIAFGFGAHLDARVAINRALTELNQMMPPLLGLDGVDDETLLRVVDDPDARRWWREATVADHPYLCPDPAAPRTVPVRTSWQTERDLFEDVTQLRNRIETLGVEVMEVLVLDQTRPDVGLPVVKVIVPGLRHFWSRFAPGRLFDVPVQLGRLTTPTPYDQLNPVPMFL